MGGFIKQIDSAEIGSGKVKIGGTVYDVDLGKAKTNGSISDIVFKNVDERLIPLLMNAEAYGESSYSNNSSSTSDSTKQTSVSLSAQADKYIFAFYSGMFCVYKSDSTDKKRIYKIFSTSDSINVLYYSSYYYIGNGLGTASGNRIKPYCATMVMVEFPSFTDDEVAEIFQSVEVRTAVGHDQSSGATLGTNAVESGDVVIASSYGGVTAAVYDKSTNPPSFAQTNIIYDPEKYRSVTIKNESGDYFIYIKSAPSVAEAPITIRGATIVAFKGA